MERPREDEVSYALVRLLPLSTGTRNCLPGLGSWETPTGGFPLQETSTADLVLDRAGQEEAWDQQGNVSFFSQVEQKHSGVGILGGSSMVRAGWCLVGGLGPRNSGSELWGSVIWLFPPV